MSTKIGIIGGSGFDNTTMVSNMRDVTVTTRWGNPSAPLREGLVVGTPVVFLARHGHGHTLSPTGVNYRANVQALKDAGCTHILATTAVGSLRQEISRGMLVIIDQFIDFTRHRVNTFHETFENGPVHASMATPFDTTMRATLISCCAELRLPFTPRGTVVTIEGPRFSTRAESNMFRLLGADIINMSIATECALAMEIGLPYAAVGMSTDYDSWKEDEAPVSWEAVFEVFKENVEKVTSVLGSVIPRLKV